MNKIKVLIITYNSFHQIMAKAIISLEFISEDSYILDHNIREEKELYKKGHYIFLGVNKIKKFFKIFYWRFNLPLLLKKQKIDEIIIPHLAGSLCNYLFYYAQDFVKISLFHEGVLSLYKFSRKNNMMLNSNKQNILSFFLFFKYIKCDDIFPVNDTSIHRFFTPIISNTILINYDKAFQVQLNQFRFKKMNKSIALFLGTPLKDSYKLDNINIVITELLKLKDISHVIYKPHPIEYHSPLINLLSNNFSISVLNKDLAIEQITSSIAPKLVVSFASSSLINLVSSNQNVEFYSIIYEDANYKNVYNYFSNIGVYNIYI